MPLGSERNNHTVTGREHLRAGSGGFSIWGIGGRFGHLDSKLEVSSRATQALNSAPSNERSSSHGAIPRSSKASIVFINFTSTTIDRSIGLSRSP